VRPKKTILCVDDNEQSLSIRKFMLETRGYAVITCTTGQDALLTFTRKGADLVLTDLMMPFMDGVALVRALRASQETRDVRILVGGHAFNREPELWRDIGADGYARSGDQGCSAPPHSTGGRMGLSLVGTR